MHKWALTTQTEDEQEPLMVAEASGYVHWREAMEKEYKSFVHNDTRDLVLLPPNRTIVSGKWCYQAKTNVGRTVQRHKARYIAPGFRQQPRIDFTATPLPIVALTSLRALLAVATKHDIEIKQLSVDSLFMYNNLDEEIYFKQLKSFWVNGANGEKFVY